MKRILSLKSLLNFLQLLVKATVVGLVLWQAILRLLPLVTGAVYESPDAIGSLAWKTIVDLLWSAFAVFAVFGPVDFLIQRHSFMKQQRMSKDEVKREHKGQEGDPEIKGKRKELAREFAQEAPQRALARADAVIVNPTHYAVAVRYRADECGVPVVLAKGLDDSALELRRLAEGMGLPVFVHPPLARALHRVPVNQAVPEELFEALAVVLSWVDQIGTRKNMGALQ